MTPLQLHKQIQVLCDRNRDEKIVTKYAKYFKEGYDAYGLTGEKVAEISENVLAQIKNTECLYDLCNLLIRSGRYEEVWIAKELIKKWNKKLKLKIIDDKTFEMIAHWFDIGINNWAHSDVICGELLSPFLLSVSGNATSRLHEYFDSWRISDRKYKRRAVPVTMIKLLETTGDFDELFDFIEPLMMDQERVVHQGLGWFLREAWKIKPDVTEKFLLKWKDKSARLIFQYATEKMTKENKERFRKSK